MARIPSDINCLGTTPHQASGGGMLSGQPSFSIANRVQRLIWQICWNILARWTPPPMHNWRCLVLRLFGAKVGRNVRVYGSSRVWLPANLKIDDGAVLGPGSNCYNQGNVVIEQQAIISQGAHLCASSHDITDPNFQLILRPILIGARSWIAAEAFVGPGVVVGEGAVLGARAVAVRNLEPWTVYGGNPARLIKNRSIRSSALGDDGLV